MIVYHGSTEEIQNPDVLHSCRNLDFGKGFYVTTVKMQAERWAKRKADIVGQTKAVVTEYTMLDDDLTKFSVKDFVSNMDAWIDFVCGCRDGGTEYMLYDIIKGKVADDKVYRVVDMYRRGIWDKNRALQEIKVYETYDQIAFVSQKAVDAVLKYSTSYEV